MSMAHGEIGVHIALAMSQAARSSPPEPYTAAPNMRTPHPPTFTRAVNTQRRSEAPRSPLKPAHTYYAHTPRTLNPASLTTHTRM